jgi:hypothetical protein
LRNFAIQGINLSALAIPFSTKHQLSTFAFRIFQRMKSSTKRIYCVLLLMFCVGCLNAEQVQLTAIVRDFWPCKASADAYKCGTHATKQVICTKDTCHPDFENVNQPDPGIVQAQLDADEKPVFNSKNFNPTVASAQSFSQWYRNTPGKNIAYNFNLTFDNTVCADCGDNIYVSLSH